MPRPGHLQRHSRPSAAQPPPVQPDVKTQAQLVVQPARSRRALSEASLFMIFPTSWRGAGCRLVDPGGRPGPGLPGFGAPARQGRAWWMFRNPRRTRAGVSRPGGAGRSQGRRRSAASGRASRSWAWQAITIQVHRSAAAGSRSFWAVQPRTCLNSRKVLKIKSAQERLPPSVHLGRGGAGDRSTMATPAWGPGRRAGDPPADRSGCPRSWAAGRRGPARRSGESVACGWPPVAGWRPVSW